MTTVKGYIKELRMRGDNLHNAPQPYGKDVARFLVELEENGQNVVLELGHILAYALSDRDTGRS